MKQLLIAAATSALLAASVLSAPAYAATDFKMYHGSDCKVFGATAWTDLNFTGFGVRNVQTAGRNVICPLTKDQEGSLDGATNTAYVHLHYFNPPAGGSINCTVYSTVFEDVSTVTSSTSGPLTTTAGNQLFDLAIQANPAANGYNHEKFYLLCNLGPGVRLTGYSLGEYGAATNTP
jgi:opacity protein-like surface antigen